MSVQSSRRCGDSRLARVVQVYEGLSPTTLDTLTALFTPDGRFIDPFNDVTGRPAIQRVFEHMYDTLDQPRFDVLESAAQGCSGFLLWDLHFRTRGSNPEPHRIHGMTRLVFDDDGQITLHHDHWDPARQLYEEVPVLGMLMRFIRRRLSATGA